MMAATVWTRRPGRCCTLSVSNLLIRRPVLSPLFVADIVIAMSDASRFSSFSRVGFFLPHFKSSPAVDIHC